MLTGIAVVVQCFNKLDTTQGLLDSLLRCEGHEDVDLILWCDGVEGSRREEEFRPARDAVLGLTSIRLASSLTPSNTRASR